MMNRFLPTSWLLESNWRGYAEWLRTNVIAASNHQGLHGNRYEQGLQTGLRAMKQIMKQEGFTTYWD